MLGRTAVQSLLQRLLRSLLPVHDFAYRYVHSHLVLYHAWFEIRNSKFEIMNRPGDPVLAKFRSLRPAEKALPSLIYILSAMTKCGPKLVFLGPIGWGTVPHWIGPKKTIFGPNFDIGEFYDRGGPCTRGLRTIAAQCCGARAPTPCPAARAAPALLWYADSM
jgi:hypothetical protein